MTFELFISRRYFKSKPKQTFIALITLLSMAGVAIGVTALIVVIGVMAGFASDLKTRILGIEPHLIITSQEPMTNYAHVTAIAEKTPGVLTAWPIVEFQAMLRTGSRTAGALIKGVKPSTAAKGLNIQALDTLINNTVQASDLPPIVMGHDLARSLGLNQGDTLLIVAPRGTLAPVGHIPYMKRFQLVDLFQTGMYNYDGSFAFIGLQEAQILNRIGQKAMGVEIRVSRIFEATAIGRQLIAELGKGYHFKDWIQLNKNLFSALKLEKTAMFITLTLIILIATFSITSSLVMMVVEKAGDIAILRTLGAAQTQIKKIFVIQGVLIGTIGTSAGVILGAGLCIIQKKYSLIRLPSDVYYISFLPVDLKTIDVIMVAVAAMVICFLATLYPARQASRLNPVEAIRHG